MILALVLTLIITGCQGGYEQGYRDGFSNASDGDGRDLMDEKKGQGETELKTSIIKELVIEENIDYEYDEGYLHLISEKQPDGSILYGYINIDGEVIVEPQYERAEEFSDDRGAVMSKDNDKWGFINKDGDLIIKPIYDDVFSFSYGLAGVEINNKWGFINKDGEISIELIYDKIGLFSEGLAYAEIDKKKRFINNKAELVFEVDNYYEVSSFSDGLVRFFNFDNTTSKVDMGFFNKIGNLVLDVSQYNMVQDFSNGLAMVRIGEYPNEYKYGFINKKGELVVDLLYDDARSFSEGLALVNIGGLGIGNWGFINKKGKVVIEFDYFLGKSFSEGLAGMLLSKLNGNVPLQENVFINKNGESILTFEDGIWIESPFKNGLALITVSDENHLYKGRSGYINRKGEVVFWMKGEMEKWEY